MKSASNSTKKIKSEMPEQNLGVSPEQPAQQSLDDLLKENGQLYNSLRGLVTNIKDFENNSYKDLSKLSHEFAINYGNYISQSPLSKDPKSMIFAQGLDAMLNSTDNAAQKKKYIQQVIDYLSTPLSSEYSKISKLLKPSDYHNMVKGAINDPMIMFNPFVQGMGNELGKSNAFDSGLKFNQLAKNIKTDFDKGDYSNIGGYFERIPYNKEAFKNAGFTKEQTEKMMETQNQLFKSMSKGLQEENKKQLMGYIYSIAISEGAKNMSKGSETDAMNAIKSANPDPTSMLYLALNKGNYNDMNNKMAAGMNMPPNADMYNANMDYGAGG